VLPPLLGERAGVRASVSSDNIFGVGGSEPALVSSQFKPPAAGPPWREDFDGHASTL